MLCGGCGAKVGPARSRSAIPPACRRPRRAPDCPGRRRGPSRPSGGEHPSVVTTGPNSRGRHRRSRPSWPGIAALHAMGDIWRWDADPARAPPPRSTPAAHVRSPSRLATLSEIMEAAFDAFHQKRVRPSRAFIRWPHNAGAEISSRLHRSQGARPARRYSGIGLDDLHSDPGRIFYSPQPLTLALRRHVFYRRRHGA